MTRAKWSAKTRAATQQKDVAAQQPPSLKNKPTAQPERKEEAAQPKSKPSPKRPVRTTRKRFFEKSPPFLEVFSKTNKINYLNRQKPANQSKSPTKTTTNNRQNSQIFAFSVNVFWAHGYCTYPLLQGASFTFIRCRSLVPREHPSLAFWIMILAQLFAIVPRPMHIGCERSVNRRGLK